MWLSSLADRAAGASRAARAACHWPPLRRVVVEGDSMAPALVPGDRLVLVATSHPKIGAIIAVPDPRERSRVLVKRVILVDSQNRVVSIEGDNRHASTDSRVFGPVPWDDILGHAVYRYFPYARAGRLTWSHGTVGGGL